MEGIFEKLRKTTLYDEQTLVTTRNSQPRIFQSSLETEAGMVFSKRKRAPVSKQSDCHAGASGWYFERLLAWEVSLI